MMQQVLLKLLCLILNHYSCILICGFLDIMVPWKLVRRITNELIVAHFLVTVYIYRKLFMCILAALCNSSLRNQRLHCNKLPVWFVLVIQFCTSFTQNYRDNWKADKTKVFPIQLVLDIMVHFDYMNLVICQLYSL